MTWCRYFTKNESCRRMFSLSFIAILIYVLSLYAYIYHLLGCVFSCNESYYYYYYYYWISVITDRILIIGKGRGGLVSTSDKRKHERVGLKVTSRWCHRRKW